MYAKDKRGNPRFHAGGSSGGPELLLFAAAGRNRSPDQLHRKGEARDAGSI